MPGHAADIGRGAGRNGVASADSRSDQRRGRDDNVVATVPLLRGGQLVAAECSDALAVVEPDPVTDPREALHMDDLAGRAFGDASHADGRNNGGSNSEFSGGG